MLIRMSSTGWNLDDQRVSVTRLVSSSDGYRSFTVPILEGTNRYKGVVHKIPARGPLRSAHVKNIHIANIAPPTFIGIQ